MTPPNARALSHWAWGFSERFPDEGAREGLAAMASALLGVEPPALRPLPSLDDARVPEPRCAVPDELRAFCSDDREDRARHTYGRAFPDLVRGFDGDFSPAPDLVAHPRSEDEVLAALRACEREGIALVPYGGGTSVVGGVECEPAVRARYRGVLSLDLRAMDRVLALDEGSRSARVQAGATGPALEAQLAERGFTLRHFPQSFEFSTVGGWVATRAGGHFATLYTHIDERVQAVRMVTPRGVFATRRLPGDGAGPQPERLALGSEGALGVITEAWLRVLPRPTWRASASATFERFEAGVAAARALAQSGLHPANCRLLDHAEAQLNGVGDGSRCVLVLGFETAGAPEPLRAAMDEARRLCLDAGADAVTDARVRDERARVAEGRDASAGAWRDAFVNAPYLQSALVSLGLVADTFETACTWDAFDALHARVREEVTAALARECGGGRLSCRFTHVYPDGPAPYYTFVAPGGGARGPAELVAKWAAVKRAASEALLASGATITHHHAVGRTHRPYYERQVPAPWLEALRAAKRALDPSGVLNPGVLLSLDEPAAPADEAR